jgi:hypothetical protein
LLTPKVGRDLKSNDYYYKEYTMFAMSMSIGPVNVQIDTDERLSFDAIDSLMNRGAATALTLFEEHLGAVVKYDNYDNDIDCDECNIASGTEELD